MRLNSEQVTTISRYFADFSKILIGSVVIGFFIPTDAPIPFQTFTAGLGIAIASLILSIRMLK